MEKEKETKRTIKEVEKTLRSRRAAIFTKRDLQVIVIDKIREVGATQKELIRGQVLKYLWEHKKIKKIKFEFPYRPETRYLFGNITNLELAQSLKPNAYIAHRAAMFVNGLCDEYPTTIHINVEQTKNHQRNTKSLTQASIDNAFKNKVRVSNEIAEANGTQVCVTHGQKANLLGVVSKKGPQGEGLRVTSIERTLIDITVRPIYAGGPIEVLNAFKKAAGQISIIRLLQTLQGMDFVYPYHQSVGFYLDASRAYSDKEIETFKKIRKKFDFYLDYRMHSPAYSREWRVFFPRTLVKGQSI
jgi:predicted transcriptional regulator of viral defense system